MSTEQNIIHNIQAINPNLEKLKQAFPHCFGKNGDFDFAKFKAELDSSDINIAKEGYSLDWLGKSYARILASDAATTLLKEDEAHNTKPENANSQNLLIKGDNLEVLKHLSNAYYEKVKMIYIDPPYNTGSDGFVYNDDRKFTAKQLQDLAGVSEDEAKRILEFTQSNSNSHSAWLTFMYPRLYIAKQLLKDDGVIFVSIDDNEVAQLRLLMDEIFGEENFVAEFARITKKAGKTTEFVAGNNDYVIFYRKSSTSQLNKSDLESNGYNGVDEYVEERGTYKLSQTLDYDSIQYSASLDYEIEFDGEIFRPGNSTKEEMIERQQRNPKNDYCWRWSKDLFDFGLKEGFIVVKQGKKGKRIYTKTYLNANIKKNKNGYYVEIIERKKATSSLEFFDNKYSNDNSKKDLDKIFDSKVFEYAKPIELIKKITEISTNNDDLILDFFAGSGTTAHSVMQLNKDEISNRKFILVQLPELIDINKNKTSYDFVKDELGVTPPTIFEITKERIIRAVKQINAEIDSKIDKLKNELPTEENQAETANNVALKTQNAFKIFETIPIWEDYDFKAEKLANAEKLFDDDKLTEADIKALFTTWKTYDGSPLTEPVQEVDLAGYTAYYTKQKLYLMHKGFSTATLKALLEQIDADANFNPTAIIAFGYYFESKALREIAENIKTYNNKKNIDIDFITRY